MASNFNHIEVVKKLVNHAKIDVNKAESKFGATPLYIASNFGLVRAVKILLNVKDINVNQGLTTSGSTPLIAASIWGHANIVKELLAHNSIDPNILLTEPIFRENHIDTAIIAASYRNHFDVVKLLLRRHKLNMLLRDRYGKNELDYAKEKDFEDIVQAIHSRDQLMKEGDTCNNKKLFLK